MAAVCRRNTNNNNNNNNDSGRHRLPCSRTGRRGTDQNMPVHRVCACTDGHCAAAGVHIPREQSGGLLQQSGGTQYHRTVADLHTHINTRDRKDKRTDKDAIVSGAL